MGGKTKKDRKSITGFIRSIFFQSANAKSLDKTKKNNNSTSTNHNTHDQGDPIEFGVGETEKLKHFQRARPPANRRPPKAMTQQRNNPSRQSVQSMPSIVENRERVLEPRLALQPPTQSQSGEDPPSPPLGVPCPPSAKDKPVKLREEMSEEINTQKRMSQSVPNLNSDTHDDKDAKRASRKKHHERRSFWNIFNRFPKRPMEGSNSDWVLVRTVEGTLDRDSTDGLVEIKDEDDEMEHDGQIETTELRKNSRNLETDLASPVIRAQSLKIDTNLGQCNATNLSELLKATHHMSMPTEAVNWEGRVLFSEPDSNMNEHPVHLRIRLYT